MINGGHIDLEGNITTPMIYEQTGQFGMQYGGGNVLLSSVKQNGKGGKVNYDGELIIPCKYFGIDHYSEGMCKVVTKKDGVRKWGFVNEEGKEVAPCKYDGAERFKDGFGIVKKGNLKGVVDKTGALIIPCEYYSIGGFASGKFQVRKGQESFYLDENGKRVE